MRSQQEKLKKELIKLGTGEFVAVVSFWLCFFIMKTWIVDSKMMLLILYPLFVLSFILIQGSIYWFILLKRISNPSFLIKYTGNTYRILRVIDAALLCMGFLIFLKNGSNLIVKALSVFLLLFSCIEWINYYIVRLSYSYDPTVLIRHIKNKTLKKSKIAKEIDKSIDY
jgi:hypothetical protein